MTVMLHVIRDNREILERRSREIFLARAVPKPSEKGLNHGIPILIDQITAALKSETGTVPEGAIEDVATKYGGRLFGLGFTVGSSCTRTGRCASPSWGLAVTETRRSRPRIMNCST